MDTYDLRPQPKVKRKSPAWNILTLLLLLGTCGVVYYFYTLFTNPNSPLNPFPPVPLPTTFRTATLSPTPQPPDPTSTPRSVLLRSPSRTKAPTWTPLFSETPKAGAPAEPAGAETITPTPMPATAEIAYGAGTTVHPELACKWMGVGGKVVDAEGKPVVFQTIQVKGTLSGKSVNEIVLSGTNTNGAYGPSGFEIKLGDAPVDSTQQLWIMLFDTAGIPLTNKIYFDTYNDCKKNLIMVVFTKTR